MDLHRKLIKLMRATTFASSYLSVSGLQVCGGDGVGCGQL